jgi:hypothetical protein
LTAADDPIRHHDIREDNPGRITDTGKRNSNNSQKMNPKPNQNLK